MANLWAGCVPDRMRVKFKKALADPDLTSLASALALIDARMLDVLSRVDTKESGEGWKQVREAILGFKDAAEKTDAASPARLEACLVNLDSSLNQIIALAGDGLNDYAAWRESRTCWKNVASW